MLVVAGIYLISNFPGLKDYGVALVFFGALVYALKEIPGAKPDGKPQPTQSQSGTAVVTADNETELEGFLREGYSIAGEYDFNGKKKIYLTKKQS